MPAKDPGSCAPQPTRDWPGGLSVRDLLRDGAGPLSSDRAVPQLAPTGHDPHLAQGNAAPGPPSSCGGGRIIETPASCAARAGVYAPKPGLGAECAVQVVFRGHVEVVRFPPRSDSGADMERGRRASAGSRLRDLAVQRVNRACSSDPPSGYEIDHRCQPIRARARCSRGDPTWLTARHSPGPNLGARRHRTPLPSDCQYQSVKRATHMSHMGVLRVQPRTSNIEKTRRRGWVRGCVCGRRADGPQPCGHAAGCRDGLCHHHQQPDACRPVVGLLLRVGGTRVGRLVGPQHNKSPADSGPRTSIRSHRADHAGQPAAVGRDCVRVQRVGGMSPEWKA